MDGVGEWVGGNQNRSKVPNWLAQRHGWRCPLAEIKTANRLAHQRHAIENSALVREIARALGIKPDAFHLPNLQG